MNNQEIEKVIEFLNRYLDEEVYTEQCISSHIMAISALQQQLNNRWIPASERLPEDDRNINTYVTLRHKETGYISFAKMLWFYGKFEWFNGRKISDKYEVIAWKYELMPEPYKEVSNE